MISAAIYFLLFAFLAAFAYRGISIVLTSVRKILPELKVSLKSSSHGRLSSLIKNTMKKELKPTKVGSEVFNFFFIVIVGIAFIILNYILMNAVVRLIFPLLFLFAFFIILRLLDKPTNYFGRIILAVLLIPSFIFARIFYAFISFVYRKISKKQNNVVKYKEIN